MKITLFSVGTRGDVQPYLALAVAFLKAGHRVQLVTSRRFAAWVESYGVEARGVKFDAQEGMHHPEIEAAMKSRNFIRQLRVARRLFAAGAVESNEVFWEAASDSDYVVQSPTGSGALEMAAVRGIPVALASPLPFTPTRAHPSFFLPLRASLGGAINLLTHHLGHRALWSLLNGSALNPWRESLGLKPWRSFGDLFAMMRAQGAPFLYGYSEQVVPRPPDWDERQHVTGYWFLEPPDDWRPPETLLRFLESGPPPVYVGFGSLGDSEAARRTRLVLDALKRTGQRGLLLTGQRGLETVPLSDSAMSVDDVPHAWLFPRVAAVVHHGGAGSTGAGLRAGRPTVVLPFVAGDQRAWRERVVRLGAGPAAPEVQKLTAVTLAAAIDRAVNDPGIRTRAAALGEKIRAENGVGRAVELIESHARTRSTMPV